MPKKGKKGGGAKGGGKTEEEKLLFLQQRAQAEEELATKKEEILALFLKVTLCSFTSALHGLNTLKLRSCSYFDLRTSCRRSRATLP